MHDQYNEKEKAYISNNEQITGLSTQFAEYGTNISIQVSDQYEVQLHHSIGERDKLVMLSVEDCKDVAHC